MPPRQVTICLFNRIQQLSLLFKRNLYKSVSSRHLTEDNISYGYGFARRNLYFSLKIA